MVIILKSMIGHHRGMLVIIHAGKPLNYDEAPSNSMHR